MPGFSKSRRFYLVFGLLWGSALAILVTASMLLHFAGMRNRISLLQVDENHVLGMQNDAIISVINASVSDLLFLAQLNELAAFPHDLSTVNREALEHELIAFSDTRGTYDQIRVLALDGMETLRINRQADDSFAVASDHLQFKGDRYYFHELAECQALEIYVSPLDLNMENGNLERPLKPILRLGIVLFEEDAPSGYLLLNLFGSVILEAFARVDLGSPSSAFLLNPEGYWLHGPSSSVEWGFAIDDRRNDGFQFSFPQEWTRIQSEAAGQFETSNGMFTFDTILPHVVADIAKCDVLGADHDAGSAEAGVTYEWKNVSWVSPTQLRAIRMAGAAELSAWNLVGALVLGGVAWSTARWSIRRSEALQHNELLESTLQKYMPADVCDRLLDNPTKYGQLGGDSQDVAVLFADIRGFTCFAEENDPQYVVSVLNRTLTELVTPVRVFQGILDKYIGDGFLAFFEPKSNLADAAQRAVDAAKMMQTAFHNLWSTSGAEELSNLGLGIGISTGRVVVGNIGSTDSMDYTVVGDAVNVASRLQAMAGAGEILISASTRALLADTENWTPMLSTKIRGRTQPLDIYKIR